MSTRRVRPPVLLVIALGLFASSYGSLAAPPWSTVSAGNLFWDRLDENEQLLDRIYSDGGGAYLDGVSNRLFTKPGEQDWVLSFPSKNAPRYVWIDFRDRQGTSGPTGVYKERPVINTHDIGSILEGESAERPVGINTSQGRLRFNGLDGSSLALVTRIQAHEWEIDMPAGSVAVLERVVKGGSATYIDSYFMPFKTTVWCVDAANCLE